MIDQTEMIDRKVAEVRKCLSRQDRGGFRLAWDALVEAILTNLSLVSHATVANLETRVSGEGYLQEGLFLCLVAVQIAPRSTEAHCFLGHAYRRLKQYALAMPCYQKAAELAEEHALRTGDERSAFWLDASDYRRYYAECQIRLGQLNEALLNLQNIVVILKEKDAPWKQQRTYHLMQAIFRLQRSPLAAVYRLKKREAKDSL